MSCWVYRRTEPKLWTVGFYDPQGKWHTDSDHEVQDKAARRCAYLNGQALAALHPRPERSHRGFTE